MREKFITIGLTCWKGEPFYEIKSQTHMRLFSNKDKILYIFMKMFKFHTNMSKCGILL